MTKAERNDSASEPYSDELNVTSPSVLDTAEGGHIEHFSNSASESEKSDDDGFDTNDAIKKRLSTVSFGILAKAQNSLRDVESASTRKRKRSDERDKVAEEKLKALRDRLRELQNTRQDVGTKEKSKREGVNKTRSERATESRRTGSSSRQQQHKIESSDGDTVTSSGDNEFAPSSEAEMSCSESEASSTEANKSTLKKQRSSKHAPTERSSKRAVSRKRPVISLPKSTARDPRFDPLSGPLRHDAIAKKYAFLNDYQKSELAELKSTLQSKTKLSDSDREALKKKIMSMESRQKAADAKEKKREILREHRKREKEMVERGKKPFYLKKSEIKKQALVKTFEGMKGKDRDKAIERRRRKLAARERKNIPDARRA